MMKENQASDENNTTPRALEEKTAGAAEETLLMIKQFARVCHYTPTLPEYISTVVLN